MSGIKNINLKRLWFLLTFIWVSGMLLYNYPSITNGYRKSLYTKEEQNRLRKEDEFDSCLAKNNTTRWALISKYGKECLAEANKNCSGMWCLDIEKSLPNSLCIKAKSQECWYIFVAGRRASDSEFLEIKWQKFWDKKIFYLTSGYSTPFKNTLLLILLIPTFLALSPRIYKSLVSWLTIKPKL